MHVSAAVRAEETLLSNSNNHQLFSSIFGNGSGRRNSISPPAQSRKPLAASLPTVHKRHKSINLKMKLSIVILLFVLLISYTQNSIGQNKATFIDNFIENKMTESGMVGIGVAIIVDKKEVWTRGYGYADKGNKIPFTSNTIMNVASISKTITAACLMRAIEENKLSLDEDINNYLPFKVINPFFPNEKITLRHLTTHTSGITDQEPLYDNSYYYGGDSPQQLGDFLKNYFDPKGKYYNQNNFLNFKPGKHFYYSNIAAGLVGYIIEIKTSQKLSEYSKHFIFTPLKMSNTGWFLSEINLPNHSTLYNRESDTLKAIKLYGLTTYPDGGVRTSVSDLSKFFICLLNDGKNEGVRILKKKSVAEMTKPQFTEENKPDNVDLTKENHGLFWFIKDNGTKIGHTGADPSVRTFMHYDPYNKIGVILFMNTELKEVEMKNFRTSVYDEFWKYALTLKDKKTSR